MDDGWGAPLEQSRNGCLTESAAIPRARPRARPRAPSRPNESPAPPLPGKSSPSRNSARGALLARLRAQRTPLLRAGRGGMGAVGGRRQVGGWQAAGLSIRLIVVCRQWASPCHSGCWALPAPPSNERLSKAQPGHGRAAKASQLQTPRKPPGRSKEAHRRVARSAPSVSVRYPGLSLGGWKGSAVGCRLGRGGTTGGGVG